MIINPRTRALRILSGAAVIAVVLAGLWLLATRYKGPLFSRSSHQRIDFSRDIRPILNQNCTSCHGGVRQKSGVSFIFREEALGKGKSGRATIVPGNPDASELIARVTSNDPEVRMPHHAPPLQPEPVQAQPVEKPWTLPLKLAMSGVINTVIDNWCGGRFIADSIAKLG